MNAFPLPPRARLALALGLLLATSSPLRAAATAPALEVRGAAGEIRLDGDLSDPGWRGAAVIDEFWETQPGDNVPPKVATKVWVTYDESHLYIGFRCEDPDPSRIRAPFVERDKVYGTDDNVAVFLDTRGDGLTALELRVSPRGQQGDAVFNDASQSEDFSPDVFYDTAARITDFGWAAEMRVPARPRSTQRVLAELLESSATPARGRRRGASSSGATTRASTATCSTPDPSLAAPTAGSATPSR